MLAIITKNKIFKKNSQKMLRNRNSSKKISLKIPISCSVSVFAKIMAKSIIGLHSYATTFQNMLHTARHSIQIPNS